MREPVACTSSGRPTQTRLRSGTGGPYRERAAVHSSGERCALVPGRRAFPNAANGDEFDATGDISSTPGHDYAASVSQSGVPVLVQREMESERSLLASI